MSISGQFADNGYTEEEETAERRGFQIGLSGMVESVEEAIEEVKNWFEKLSKTAQARFKLSVMHGLNHRDKGVEEDL